MRLYCGNISYETTETDLKKFFEDAGFTVEDAKVITDRDTGRARGFGFVTLGGSNASEAIGELNEQTFMGRKIVVNEAKEKAGAHRRDDRGGGPRGGRDSRGGGRGRDRYDD